MKLLMVALLSIGVAAPAAPASPKPSGEGGTPAAPKPPGAGGPNRPPVVRARCEPCSVPVGKIATVTADASDPDGNRLKYKWSAPAGSLKKASKQETTFTAPMVEGPVFVTVRVDDRKGAIASDVITIQVIKAPAQ